MILSYRTSAKYSRVLCEAYSEQISVFIRERFVADRVLLLGL